MRNLAELDWRVGQGQYGLSLLDGIWQHIKQNFLAESPYGRRKLFEDLFPAAFFQPEEVLQLIDIARSHPASHEETNPHLRLRDAQDYVFSVVPPLLEATAHSLSTLQRSVDILWSLSHEESGSENSDRTARNTLKRLASYQLNGWAAFNFAILLQCVRLCRTPNAFDSSFTPIDVLDQILEREGEFTESDGSTFRFGGFGLNYSAVEYLRKNAIDFLEHLVTEGDDRIAVRVIRSLDSILHNYLNRVGRVPTQDELDWQNAERLACLEVLKRRLQLPQVSLPIRSEIYDAVRSGTGFNYTEPVRHACLALLPQLERSPDLAIFDALSRREGDLPLIDQNSPADSWMQQYGALIDEAHSALSTLDEEVRADKLVEFVKLAHAAWIETRGFNAIVHSFSRDGAFVTTLADQLIADKQGAKLIRELAMTLDALHSYAPQNFHRRAVAILLSGSEHLILAASSALRVYTDNATHEDAGLIREYLGVQNPIVKRNALGAIAYMGKSHAVIRDLLEAALSVEVGSDANVADALADAFGPYGIPVSLLSSEEMKILLEKFLPIEDFDAHQGSIPRFLGTLVDRYPDEVLDLLLKRVSIEERRRSARDWTFRALGSSYHAVSFGNVPSERKSELLRTCMSSYLISHYSDDSYTQLFWGIDPLWEYSFEVVIDALGSATPDQISKIELLLHRSPRGWNQVSVELGKRMNELPSESPIVHVLKKIIADAEARQNRNIQPPDNLLLSD